MLMPDNHIFSDTPVGLIQEALRAGGDGLKALLDILKKSNLSELDWLEFKAVTVPARKPENELDKWHHWNVARAVISLANFQGGAVLVGIDNKTMDVIGLEHSKGWETSKNGDDFIRKFVKPVFSPPWQREPQREPEKDKTSPAALSGSEECREEEKRGKQKKGKERNETSTDFGRVSIPDSVREERIFLIDGKPVLVIVVFPAPNNALLAVEYINQPGSFYPVRLPGHRGEVYEASTPDVLIRQRESRQFRRGDISHLFTQLRSRLSGSGVALSQGESAKLVPPGLLSFTEKDSGAFLDLLPGLRTSSGLPQSVQFWLDRIRDPLFTVGLLMGPSGCGKTSFMLAGVLPRATDDQTRTIYLKATPDETESALRNRIAAMFGLSREMSLLDCIKAACATAERGTSTLVVIDQFEQWLYVHGYDDGAELQRAMQWVTKEQAADEPPRFKCIFLVRADYWALTSHFFDGMIGLNDQETLMTMQLFRKEHARNVLRRIGEAYGRIPSGKVTEEEQQAFLEKVVDAMAVNDCVVPIQLSLFVEIARDWPDWSVASLKDIGGAERIGYWYLEERLRVTDTRRHSHLNAIINVLEALLPEAGTDIKKTASRDELLAASQYKNIARFDEMMRILEDEFRIVVRVLASGEDTGGGAVSSHYQIIHDFLIPSLHEWIRSKRSGTSRGRAEQRLRRRAAEWARQPEGRYLPSFLEYASIRRYTPKWTWTATQAAMMKKAARRYMMRFVVTCAVLAATAGAAWWVDLTYKAANEERMSEADSLFQEAESESDLDARIRGYMDALVAYPHHLSALKALCWTYGTHPDALNPGEALKYADRLLAESDVPTASKSAAAAAYASNKLFPKAIELQQEVLKWYEAKRGAAPGLEKQLLYYYKAGISYTQDIHEIADQRFGKAQGVEDWENILKFDPCHFEVLRMLCLTYACEPRYLNGTRAVECADMLLGIADSPAEVKQLAGFAYARAGDFEKAAALQREYVPPPKDNGALATEDLLFLYENKIAYEYSRLLFTNMILDGPSKETVLAIYTVMRDPEPFFKAFPFDEQEKVRRWWALFAPDEPTGYRNTSAWYKDLSVQMQPDVNEAPAQKTLKVAFQRYHDAVAATDSMENKDVGRWWRQLLEDPRTAATTPFLFRNSEATVATEEARQWWAGLLMKYSLVPGYIQMMTEYSNVNTCPDHMYLLHCRYPEESVGELYKRVNVFDWADLESAALSEEEKERMAEWWALLSGGSDPSDRWCQDFETAHRYWNDEAPQVLPVVAAYRAYENAVKQVSNGPALSAKAWLALFDNTQSSLAAVLAFQRLKGSTDQTMAWWGQFFLDHQEDAWAFYSFMDYLVEHNISIEQFMTFCDLLESRGIPIKERKLRGDRAARPDLPWSDPAKTSINELLSLATKPNVLEQGLLGGKVTMAEIHQILGEPK